MVRDVALTPLDGYGHEAVVTLEGGASAPCGDWTWADQVGGCAAVHRALESVREQ
jgi:hypothetical protein